MIDKGGFIVLKEQVAKVGKLVNEIEMMQTEVKAAADQSEKDLFDSQIRTLQNSLKHSNDRIKEELDKLNLAKKLNGVKPTPKVPPSYKATPVATQKPVNTKPTEFKGANLGKVPKDIKLTELEKNAIKRLKKKEDKVVKKKEKTPNEFKRIANKMFARTSEKLLAKGHFKGLQRNLTRANMNFLAKSYISMILFSTFISIFVAIFVFMFFMFFNFGVKFPFITAVSEGLILRFVKVVWIIFIIPIGTFIFVLTYPLLERRSKETYINNELPFATIHMASIAESMIEPSNIFKIMVQTREYPHLEKEFIKVTNDINVLGYDLVTALRNVAYNSPSKKLAELLDGLATTITSGGDLAVFFEKRAQSLLFDYKIEKEKQTKSAETFMDIYISVVIAAPMILMLLLIMMRISGLGLTLSTNMISLVMVLGVSFINAIFLIFLQLKGQREA